MQKLQKTVLMLLVISTVIFAAGCAEQGGKKTNESTSATKANVTPVNTVTIENL